MGSTNGTYPDIDLSAEIFAALAPHRNRAAGTNRYNAPWRTGSDSGALSVEVDANYGGHIKWQDFVADEGGNGFTLADRLGIQWRSNGQTQSSKRGYDDHHDYAQQHGVAWEVFAAAGWEPGDYQGRPALRIPTANGPRYRFLDGEKPRFKHAPGYERCWYGLERAVSHISDPAILVLCNGEPSTVVAQHYDVPACCIAGGGGEKEIPDDLLPALEEFRDDCTILIALDCDGAGRAGARKQRSQLQALGYTVRAVDLRGGDGFDLADFCHLYGNSSYEALLALPDLPEPAAPQPSCPPLPAAAQVAEPVGACRWLEEYIRFSRKWSPDSYDGFHEACGLWVLSTIAARRVALHLGRRRYPSLYIALCARTGLYSKSGAAEIAQALIQEAGLDFLLAPDDATPQAFVKSLVPSVVPGQVTARDGVGTDLPPELRMRLAFVGQRGWFYEEFGQKLDGMMKGNGTMADFRGLLRRFDDHPAYYRYLTIGRGQEDARNPYLALLCDLTPADLRPHAMRGAALWNDGFFARVAFVAPPAGTNPQRGRTPHEQRVFPDSLVAPLRRWHAALGVPDVAVSVRTDSDGNSTGVYDVLVGDMPAQTIVMHDAIYDAFYRYRHALLDLVAHSENEDTDGNYVRFAEKALRLAMLFASLENGGVIEGPQWALAQAITERWRANLHHLVDQLTDVDASRPATVEDKVIQIIRHHGKMTRNQIKKYISGTSEKELSDALSALVEADALIVVEITRKKTAVYAVNPEQLT